MPLPPARSPFPDSDAGALSASEAEPVADAGDAGAPAAATADGDADEPYRVLIVEDDRSQAMFAESVLGGSGIQTHAVAKAADVLPALDAFRPELVLMDLHLPDMEGTSLTQRIRAHEQFAHIPIVFLTGDPDPELQYQALEVGADDFLSKPIRPRHLIAAVQSRVQRARALYRAQDPGQDRNPATGLLHRPELMRRIAAHPPGTGGALCVEIQNAGALRDRYGFAGFEHLMNEAGRHLAAIVGELDAARLNDCLNAVLAPDGVCSQVVTELPWREACETAPWVGTVQPGSACFFNHDCAGAPDSFCGPDQKCKAKPTAGGGPRTRPLRGHPGRADRSRLRGPDHGGNRGARPHRQGRALPALGHQVRAGACRIGFRAAAAARTAFRPFGQREPAGDVHRPA